MTGKATEVQFPYDKDPMPVPGGFFDGVSDRLLMLQQIAGKAQKATKDDLETVANRAAAMQTLVDQDDEDLAKFKIEVHFEKGRTNRDAFAGIVVVF